MRITLLNPAPSNPVPFDYAAVQLLPDLPGCYVLANAAGDVIYIGQAVSLPNRLLQHLDSGRHRELTKYGRASFVCVLTIERVVTLSAHERGWLNQCELADGELPPLNKVHGPI